MRSKTAPDGTDLWAFGAGTLLAISDEATYIAQLEIAELYKAAADILAEGVPVDVRLSEAKKIPHKKLLNVCGNEKKRKLEIRYHSLGAAVFSHGVATSELDLPDDEVFHDILESFRRHLGPTAKLDRKAYTPLRATVEPIAVAAFIAFGTWFFASGLGGNEDYAPSGRSFISRQIAHKVIQALGPSGVIALGVLAILGCAWWAYRRYRHPPITVIVKPK